MLLDTLLKNTIPELFLLYRALRNCFVLHPALVVSLSKLVPTNYPYREFDLLRLALACYFKSKSLLLLPLSYKLPKKCLYNLKQRP